MAGAKTPCRPRHQMGVTLQQRTRHGEAGSGAAQRVRRAFREEGFWGVVRRTYRFLSARAFATTGSTWFQRSLMGSGDSARDAATPAELSVQIFDDDKSRLIEWLRDHHREFPWMALPEELEQAQTSAHVFAGFVLADHIVGYVKVGVDSVYVHDFRRVVRFPPGDCFVYDTFVLPGYRHRGIAYRGVMATMAELERRGLDRIWCHIEPWNAASLELFRRAGFQEMGRIRFVRMLGMPFFLRDSLAPSISLERLLRRPIT